MHPVKKGIILNFVYLPRYRPGPRVPTGDPPVGELVDHEEDVGLEETIDYCEMSGIA